MTAQFEHIGRELKFARLNKGLSQRALAKNSGIPQSHISKIEKRGVDLTLSSLLALTRALDLEPMLVPRTSIHGVRNVIEMARTEAQTPRPAYALAREDDD